MTAVYILLVRYSMDLHLKLGKIFSVYVLHPCFQKNETIQFHPKYFILYFNIILFLNSLKTLSQTCHQENVVAVGL